MTIREAKRGAFLALQQCVREMQPDAADVRITRKADAVRFETVLSDGARALIQVQTLKLGLPAGQFALSPAAILTGGRMRLILDECRLPAHHGDALNAVLVAQGDLLPGGREYWKLGTDPAPTVARVAKAVVGLLTVMRAFDSDWPAVREVALAHPAQVVHALAVALAATLLSGEDDLSSVLALAPAQPWLAADLKVGAGVLERRVRAAVRQHGVS